ncbi:nucleoside triphosphate pyrophosphohydrolase [Slackia equolifaciens]|uniref:Nucleoside triphosphate pyrophosphohydrolase n=1 Tax=Slackia equolifaciens TaxID=498718 RepID=A0A3N0AT66_9ACTN|nr:nucleoside triphosphate pyrophosphohydrolase [Slackia equolifaciens]RNL38053.1 nucleoside triphosphate pyrophosphohydrolase [Slackia equolifaciens]
MASHPDFDAFVATIARLRAPDGCPWDREQTHQSIAHNMIEEAYEAVDAIETGDARHLREELGDVLLQVVLQAQIAADAGEFTIDDVCRDINEKMVRRHPHVFGDATAETAKDTSEIWARVKMEERKAAQAAAAAQNAAEVSGDAVGVAAIPVGDASVLAGKPEGLLDGVPTSFPALMQAQKISRKVVAAGFEWPDEEGVWEKVAEEVEEFKNAAPEDAELEFGDVLFSVVNVARWRGIDAENALRATCVKFRRRWAFIEGAAWAQGKDAADLTVEEQEALWQEAKRREKK